MSKNIFLDNEIFLNITQFNLRNKEIKNEQLEIIKKSKFSIDDVVAWFKELEDTYPTEKDLVEHLYYVYTFPEISNIIGWSKKPNDIGIGGYLNLDFYKKLLISLSEKSINNLFAYLPGELQTDELLINYMKYTPKHGSGSIVNFSGDNLKTSTLEWLIDNKLGSIRDWKPSWWTKDLKDRAIKKEDIAIVFIPEKFITPKEVATIFANQTKPIADHFFKALPESFQNNIPIFVNYIITRGGLNKNYRDFYNKPIWSKEMALEYFKKTPLRNSNDWNMVQDNWKTQDLIDAAILKCPLQIALDETLTLSDEELDKIIDNTYLITDKAYLANKLNNDGKLTKEMIERLHLAWAGIESLPSSKDVNNLMKNDDVLFYLVSNGDDQFLSKKTNWPSSKRVTPDLLIYLILNLFYDKLKKRITDSFNDDDYVYMYLKANEFEKVKKIKIRTILKKLVDDGLISVEQETVTMVDNLGEDATYEGYKTALDIFIF